MPRRSRIDHPGLLVHVMVRGIERCPLFLEDCDRIFFLNRLAWLLAETGTTLLAWTLMTNHLHLLIRLTGARMATLMSRLLTSYAQYFNLRYDRVGHLFQNRYRSLVCEEQGYLLESVRYIHLNPYRAGLAPTLDDLDRYPWCGHAVLMGKGQMPGQAVEEVLGLFGPNPAQALKNYRDFVEKGIPLGRRPDLVGQQSPSGQRERGSILSGLKVLGTESFFESLAENVRRPEILLRSVPLEILHSRVARSFSLDPREMQVRGRRNRVSEARAVFCFLGVKCLGYSAEEVGRYLGIGGTGVSKAVRRGFAKAEPLTSSATWFRP